MMKESVEKGAIFRRKSNEIPIKKKYKQRNGQTESNQIKYANCIDLWV